ncbi:NADP-dependent oxidoreductase [Kribbella sp. NPDC023855]|uniref:NADP-dependent oxidoreductase n=1 Tax=Kribbella sp. NPDC023855 TaxID=3154698 RepID=UPI0033CE4DBE
MSKAIRFSRHGGVGVLEVADVAQPQAGPGEIVVAVRAAGINPLDSAIREGVMQSVYPVAAYPSGQGQDFAGVIDEVGPDVVTFEVGDEVLGFLPAPGAAQAEYVVASINQVVAKPAGVSWEMAGGLYTAGAAAYAAVRAVRPTPGETVVVAGAAGGVGSVAVQLARRTGAKVIGIAGPDKHAWLSAHGVTPVAYGNDLRKALGAPDALIDAFGNGYVDLAIDLGVPPERINTVIDFEAAAKHGTRADGCLAVDAPQVLTELAALLDKGELEVPIAATYSLDQVHEAFAQLEQRHTLGKIILRP